MKRFDTTRAAAVIAGLGFAPAALAVEGGMTATGWASLLAVPVVVGILWVVHKRIG